MRLHFDTNETTVECARRLGTEPDWYNPDQYARSWNPEAHYRYLAPQLWNERKISILTIPAGTMGTCMGLARYAREHGCGTHILPVMCAVEEEVPGARTWASIKRDIRQPWEELFPLEDVVFGARHASFYLSFLSWTHTQQQLGPSFGLAFAGALSFLKRCCEAKTLDRYRDVDGLVRVVVFGPDDYRPYTGLYLGELKKKELSAKTPPSDLLRILE
jgi:cysteine synthase